MNLENNEKHIKWFRFYLIMCVWVCIPITVIPMFLRGDYALFGLCVLGLSLMVSEIMKLTKLLRKFKNQPMEMETIK